MQGCHGRVCERINGIICGCGASGSTKCTVPSDRPLRSLIADPPTLQAIARASTGHTRLAMYGYRSMNRVRGVTWVRQELAHPCERTGVDAGGQRLTTGFCMREELASLRAFCSYILSRKSAPSQTASNADSMYSYQLRVTVGPPMPSYGGTCRCLGDQSHSHSFPALSQHEFRAPERI